MELYCNLILDFGIECIGLVGDLEAGTLVSVESSVEYHSFHARILSGGPEAGHRTVSGGQFDCGGRLLKSNGGAQRSPQGVWKPPIESAKV